MVRKLSLTYWVYGWLELAQGFVRVLTFGAVGPPWSTSYIFWIHMRRLKAKSVLEGRSTYKEGKK